VAGSDWSRSYPARLPLAQPLPLGAQRRTRIEYTRDDPAKAAGSPRVRMRITIRPHSHLPNSWNPDARWTLLQPSRYHQRHDDLTLTGIAGSANKPQVTERPAGYAATLQVSPFTYLSLYRADDPIPSGNVGEATYRSDLLARLDDSKAITAKGAVTLLGGHDAWTIVDVQRVGPLIAYTYKAYVIVDQHPYRLTVSSLGSQRPAEFDATVKAVSSSIKFEPLQRSAESHSASVPGAMPRFVSGGHEEYYPASSSRRREQGIVDLEFSIDGQGHVSAVE
jgi:hypothetical protein